MQTEATGRVHRGKPLPGLVIGLILVSGPLMFLDWPPTLVEKVYYSMSKPGASGCLDPLTTFHFPAIQNIKRDPFEQNVVPAD